MSTNHWDALREMNDLQRSINRLIDGRLTGEPRVSEFPVDVYETAGEVVLRADLPGVRAEDIQIRHHDGQVHIRASRSTEVPEGAAWILRQLPAGTMARAFTLGIPVDVDQVQASYDGGVLEVHLPKEEHARPRQIPVTAGPSRQTLRRGGTPEPGGNENRDA